MPKIPEIPEIKTYRSFGLVMAGFFSVLTFLHLRQALLLQESYKKAALFFVISGVFVLFALLRPALLKYPNFVWMKFAEILQRVMNPIVMGILFFLVLTPYALFSRLLGKKFLLTLWDSSCTSYWMKRDDEKRVQKNLQRQF